MGQRVFARHHPALGMRIVRRTPLYYDDDPGEELERPPKRAGSSYTVLPFG